MDNWMYEFVVQERSDTQHVAVVHICMGSCTAGDYVNAEEAFQEQRLAPGVKAEDDHKNGNAYIRKLLVHTNGPLGFHTSVLTEITEHFGAENFKDSPCVYASLKISYTGNIFYHIEITTRASYAKFTVEDVEKTVVRPGYSSFLITEFRDLKNVLSLATMPNQIKSTLLFPVRSWFLYNFGSTKGRNWTISLKPCNYWVQQDDHNILSLNVVKYLDVGNKENYELKLIPNTRVLGLHVPSEFLLLPKPEETNQFL
nr:cation channel sperm-associated protein subunit beta-like [Peromyscus maniculatus bairdii]